MAPAGLGEDPRLHACALAYLSDMNLVGAVRQSHPEKLSRDELAGVMAHEISHIRHYDIRFAMLGGSIVAGNALLRAYIWHCVALPPLAAMFMAVHFWRVRKDGGISVPL